MGFIWRCLGGQTRKNFTFGAEYGGENGRWVRWSGYQNLWKFYHTLVHIEGSK
jgi:hypothetical protein